MPPPPEVAPLRPDPVPFVNVYDEGSGGDCTFSEEFRARAGATLGGGGGFDGALGAELGGGGGVAGACGALLGGGGGEGALKGAFRAADGGSTGGGGGVAVGEDRLKAFRTACCASEELPVSLAPGGVGGGGGVDRTAGILGAA